MAEFDTIFDITKKFRTDRELREYAAAQYKALEAATKKIESLMVEVEHLKTLLASTTTLIEAPKPAPPQPKPKPVVRIEAPTEQTICEIELKRLQVASLERPLTFEETKKLDLLVKNLFLSRGQANLVADFRHLPDGVSEADLLEMVNEPSPNE